LRDRFDQFRGDLQDEFGGREVPGFRERVQENWANRGEHWGQFKESIPPNVQAFLDALRGGQRR